VGGYSRAVAKRSDHLAWRLVRSYVVGFPRGRGKRPLLRAAQRVFPTEAFEFDTAIPGGGTLRLRWDEVIGRETLRDGVLFESAEIAAARDLVAPGDCAFDVGANVGLLTVPLALAVGEEGLVVAVEPLEANVSQLLVNAALNSCLDRVRPIVAAAAATDGMAVFNVATDPAFGSLQTITKRGTAGEKSVVVRSLDSIWRDLNEPRVALLKIDVEGGESDVLDGAENLLDQCRPAILVEADSDGAVGALTARVSRFGYVDQTPMAFRSNRLFLS
jgi:FkbM family methyltransferase